MQQENKYEKLPKNMYPQVRQQVMDRIAVFEKVIEDHEIAQKNITYQLDVMNQK